MTASPSIGAMPDDPLAGHPAASSTVAPPPAHAPGPAASPAAAIIVAALLAGAGITALARSRWQFGPGLRFGRFGAPSELTLALAGVVLLLGAYHAVVYGLGIGGYRLPIWTIVVAGPLVVIASFAMDALDNRHTDAGEP